MSADVYGRIKANPKFQELVQRRSRFAWLLSLAVLVIFYGFILLVAFNPAMMATRLGGDASLVTLGPVVILSMFVLFWLLTALYVKRANGEFDELNRAIVQDAEKKGAKR
jgi:cation/acetate symporter